MREIIESAVGLSSFPVSRAFAFPLLFLAAQMGLSAESSAPQHFTVEAVGEGVYAAIAKEGSRASVGNAGFVLGPSSVLVVDSYATASAAEELLAAIRRITPAPVRWVVNTHYHLDHVGGNAVFARAGASIIAHRSVRAWLRTENLRWREEIKPEEKAILANLVQPDITHRDGLTVWLGDRRVDVLSRPGHTGGDSVVFARDANVLFTGDLVWKRAVPNLIDANTEEWIDTLDGFLADHPGTTFVPGHGKVARALDVRFFRDYLSGLRLAVARAIDDGKSGTALVQALLPDQRARFGSWAWFAQSAEKNILRTEEELRGTKRFLQPAER
jgi:glyoxylase-like metal-dependent hydrolase (beta-lactamase superfamily II)